MKTLGTLFILLGLCIAGFAVLNNKETDVDALLRQNNAALRQREGELRSVQSAVEATGATVNLESAHADSQATLDANAEELRDREKARQSSFNSTMVVAAIFAVLGFLMKK